MHFELRLKIIKEWGTTNMKEEGRAGWETKKKSETTNRERKKQEEQQ